MEIHILLHLLLPAYFLLSCTHTLAERLNAHLAAEKKKIVDHLELWYEWRTLEADTAAAIAGGTGTRSRGPCPPDHADLLGRESAIRATLPTAGVTEAVISHSMDGAYPWGASDEAGEDVAAAELECQYRDARLRERRAGEDVEQCSVDMSFMLHYCRHCVDTLAATIKEVEGAEAVLKAQIDGMEPGGERARARTRMREMWGRLRFLEERKKMDEELQARATSTFEDVVGNSSEYLDINITRFRRGQREGSLITGRGGRGGRHPVAQVLIPPTNI